MGELWPTFFTPESPTPINAAADIYLTPLPPKKNRSARRRRRSKSPGAPPPKEWRRRRALLVYSYMFTISWGRCPRASFMDHWTSILQTRYCTIPQPTTWAVLDECTLTQFIKKVIMYFNKLKLSPVICLLQMHKRSCHKQEATSSAILKKWFNYNKDKPETERLWPAVARWVSTSDLWMWRLIHQTIVVMKADCYVVVCCRWQAANYS